MLTPLPKLLIEVQMVETKMSEDQSEPDVAAIAEKRKSHFLFGVG